jgi:hypothetical protein
MRFIGVLMVFAGCQSGGTAMPDTPEGTHDGQGPQLGMFVSWNAQPALPGPLTDKITVSEATFQLNHFQIVADSGNSMHSRYLLAWSSGMAPSQEAFHDATAGVYSQASLDLGGTLVNYAYRIRGMWAGDKAPRPFEIRDDQPLTVTIDCNKMLAAAGWTDIAITVDLRGALGSINFKDLEDEEGLIEITNQGSHMGALQAFRGHLQDAFKSQD